MVVNIQSEFFFIGSYQKGTERAAIKKRNGKQMDSDEKITPSETGNNNPISRSEKKKCLVMVLARHMEFASYLST